MIGDALVFVLDEDPSVRVGVSRVLRAVGYAVETFARAHPLLVRLPGVQVPCCVVSDVHVTGMGGVALQAELRSGSTPVPLVLLTRSPGDIATTVRAMREGALDVLEKPVRPDVLRGAVAVAVARARTEAQRRRGYDTLLELYQTLTPRERQVFCLVTAGLLNKQVGFELGTSEKTVKVQRARVMTKMAAGSLAELVRMSDRLAMGPTDVTRCLTVPRPEGAPRYGLASVG